MINLHLISLPFHSVAVTATLTKPLSVSSWSSQKLGIFLVGFLLFEVNFTKTLERGIIITFLLKTVETIARKKGELNLSKSPLILCLLCWVLVSGPLVVTTVVVDGVGRDTSE